MKEIDKLFDRVNLAFHEGFPFVVYRKPDGNRISVLIQKNKTLVELNGYREAGFVMAPFSETDKKVLFSLEYCSFYSVDYHIESDVHSDAYLPDQAQKPANDQQTEYMHLIDKALHGINAHKYTKIVLSRAETVALKSFEPALIFQRLIKSYPETFAYVWYHPQVGIWAGASPETLLKVDKEMFKTMSLAGTQKYQNQEQVKWGDKEVDEQQLVTDQIVDLLHESKLTIGKPYTKKAGSLLHLCTDISGRFAKGQDLKNILYRLHPTAAVCGLPKAMAKEFILSNEGYHRKYYSGYLGELNYSDNQLNSDNTTYSKEVSNLYVNLRCMEVIQINGIQAVIYVGGGITRGSNPLQEWNETVQKSRVMKRILEN